MSKNCTRKASCRNIYRYCQVVLDTSSLINIMDAAIYSLSKRGSDVLFDDFYDLIEKYLIKIRYCSQDGLIHTTKEVYENEMNLNNASSAVNECDALNGIFDSSRERTKLRRLLALNIRASTSALNATQLQGLRRELNKNRFSPRSQLDRNDLSLLLLGLTKSINSEMVVLTDDSIIHEALEYVQKTRKVNFLSKPADTLRTFCVYSVSFFEEPFKCCELTNDNFYSLYSIIYDYAKKTEEKFEDNTNMARLGKIIIRIASEVSK